MGKIEEKKRQKKEALLASAFQLFTEKGIDNTSISEIAKNANMAKGTFYLYFKDKYAIQDCLVAYEANRIFEKAHIQLNNELFQKVSDSFEDAIICLVDCVIEQLNENPVILRFIAKNLSWGIFSNIRISDLDNQNCMDIFDELIQKSKKKFRQKELMVFMIVELVNATCYNVILNHSPVGIEDLKKDLYAAIRSILEQFELQYMQQPATAA